MTLMFGLSCANSTWDGAQKQEKEIKNKNDGYDQNMMSEILLNIENG